MSAAFRSNVFWFGRTSSAQCRVTACDRDTSLYIKSTGEPMHFLRSRNCFSRGIILCGLVLFIASVPPAVSAQENLHEKALKNNGQFTLIYRAAAGTVYSSLEELGGDSDVIVVGRLVGKRGHFNDARTTVVTDHSFIIESVYKGNVKTGDTIIVSMNGGRARHRDGSTVTASACDERPVARNIPYLIFMQKRKDDNRGYTFTGGAQGAYELNSVSGLVMPAYLNEAHPIVRQFANVRNEQFLAAVGNAVALKH
jgi:hypothetical protein